MVTKGGEVAPGRKQRKESQLRQPNAAASRASTTRSNREPPPPSSPPEIDQVEKVAGALGQIEKVAATLAKDNIRDSNFTKHIFQRIQDEVNNNKSQPPILPPARQEQRDDEVPQVDSDFQSVGPSSTKDSIMEWMSQLVETNEEDINTDIDFDGRDDVDESYAFLFSGAFSQGSAARRETEEAEDVMEDTEMVNFTSLGHMEKRDDSQQEQREACPDSSHEEETENSIVETNFEVSQTVEAPLLVEQNSAMMHQRNSTSSSETSSSYHSLSGSVVEDVGYLPIDEHNEMNDETRAPTPIPEGDVAIAQFSTQADDVLSEETTSNDSNVVNGEFGGSSDETGKATDIGNGEDKVVQGNENSAPQNDLPGGENSKDSTLNFQESASFAPSSGDEELLQGSLTNIRLQKATAPEDYLMNDSLGYQDSERAERTNGEVAEQSQTAPVPGRLSKPKISSWGRKKRLKKHEQIKEKQITSNSAIDSTGAVAGATTDSGDGEAQAQSEQRTPTPKQDQSTLTLREITMKNRARQEKKAFGRVKLRAKNKNSIIGVGEIFSTTNGKGQFDTPFDVKPIIPDAKKTKHQVTFKEELNLQKSESMPTSDDPEMPDKVHWSASGTDVVEIVPVESDDESAQTSKDQDEGIETEDAEVEEKDGSRGEQEARHRERRRQKRNKKIGRTRRREISLAVSSSDLSDDMELCACREAIGEGPILCHAIANEEENMEEEEDEESGCWAITHDLAEMATELVSKGPAVILKWLE